MTGGSSQDEGGAVLLHLQLRLLLECLLPLPTLDVLLHSYRTPRNPAAWVAGLALEKAGLCPFPGGADFSLPFILRLSGHG